MSALPPKADMCSATRDVRFGPIADMRVHGSRLWRYGGKYIVGRHRATDALKRKIANGFDVDGIFNRSLHPRTNQDLPRFGFVEKTRRDIGYRSDCGVIETSLKANGAERRKSVCDTDAKAKLMS